LIIRTLSGSILDLSRRLEVVEDDDDDDEAYVSRMSGRRNGSLIYKGWRWNILTDGLS